jgi:uncharacterized protein (TIGR04222 family)
VWLLFLLPAFLVTSLSALRLCRLVAATDVSWAPRPEPLPERVDLYEAAYLAGGPERVVDLTLVTMAEHGRLHLAHTGWTTVVEASARTELERAALEAIGPEGQCPTSELRAALASGPTVQQLAGRLAAAGLAVPKALREDVAAAVAAVRRAGLTTLALLAAALCTVGRGDGAAAPLLAWFALPLVLAGGTLALARIELYPVTRWAAPNGQALLRALRPRRTVRSTDLLLAVAVAGLSAVSDRRLRVALRPRRAL